MCNSKIIDVVKQRVISPFNPVVDYKTYLVFPKVIHSVVENCLIFTINGLYRVR